MEWALIVFGVICFGLGIDAVRNLSVKRPTSRQVAEALHGPGAAELPPALEDMARTRWLIQGASLAQLMALVLAVFGMLSLGAGVLLLI